MNHSDPRFPNGPPQNGCARCYRDFASLKAFDAHRGGDSLCDDVDEDPGWIQDKRGRWTTTKFAEDARGAGERFRALSELSHTP